MNECLICGTSLEADAKACLMCGTTVPADTGTRPLPPTGPAPSAPAPPPVGTTSTSPPTPERTGSRPLVRECLDCGKNYGPDFADNFCTCGTELREAADSKPPLVESKVNPSPTVPPFAEPFRPTVGAACLVVYSADKQPIHYQTLDRDVTLIGRTDGLGGMFADLDLGRFFDDTLARKVSRKHAVILRFRDSGSYVLRPLAKNTGTQIEREMAVDLKDYPLVDGTRIILGGQVRLKFEIVK